MSRNSNVENARRFWDNAARGGNSGDMESGGALNNRRSAHSSRTSAASSGFSTRDFNVVDQSVNLMDLGGSSTTNNKKKPSTTNSNSISGLFRTKLDSENLNKFTDEFGDADAMNQADAEEHIYRRRRRLPPLSQLCTLGRGKILLTIVVAVVASLLVFTSFHSLEEEIEQEKHNSRNKDYAETGMKDRLESIQTRILDQGVTPKSVLGGASPQQLALDWIVLDDPAALEVSHPALMDRYGLAVLFFGMGGSRWRSSDNWMSSRGICSWQGVECAPKEQEASAETNYAPYTTTYDEDTFVIGIKLKSNLLKGSLPDEFGTAFEELVTIDLEDNQLYGTLPVALSQSQHLSNLLLGHNLLTGNLPKEYASLENLHRFSVSHNSIKGTIPTEWESGLAKLRQFSVSHNQISGKFPNLLKMKRLTGLFLEANEFDGPLPESLQEMTSLLDLELANNKFTGGISVLGALSNLETLDLSNNAFSGTIPDMFDQLFRLHELVLANNKFEGSIPHTIPHLQTLKTLDLNSNRLKGELPAGLGSMTDIITMSLRNNMFEGTIPTQLGKLDDIQTLSLNHNLLNGPIPTELGLCFRLNALHLQNNKLTGMIPKELGELSGLSNLKLELNSFQGATVPPQVCALRDDDLSILTSDCKNGKKVACDCCTQCY